MFQPRCPHVKIPISASGERESTFCLTTGCEKVPRSRAGEETMSDTVTLAKPDEQDIIAKFLDDDGIGYIIFREGDTLRWGWQDEFSILIGADLIGVDDSSYESLSDALDAAIKDWERSDIADSTEFMRVLGELRDAADEADGIEHIREFFDEHGMGYRVDRKDGKYRWLFTGDGEPDVDSGFTFDTLAEAMLAAASDWDGSSNVERDFAMRLRSAAQTSEGAA
jgi:hypothetical protein